MQDILALAFQGYPIRTTNETPRRISVLDVLAAVGYADPRKSWYDIQESYPELVGKLRPITFGRGRPTPTLDKQGVLSLVMVLQGPKAAAFREWASSILVRYLDGDRTLAEELHLRADILEESSEPTPDEDPLQIFNEAAPGVIEVLAAKAQQGSLRAAHLLLQYRAVCVGGPAQPETVPRPEDDLTSAVRGWLATHTSAVVTGAEILAGIGISSPTRSQLTSLGIIMRKIGWHKRRQVRSGETRAWAYYRQRGLFN